MTIKLNKLVPHPDKVFVTELESGSRTTKAGIILLDDNMKNTGIRPRWGQVILKGRNVDEVEIGEWLLIDHGRWTFGIDVEHDDGEDIRIWQIEYPTAVLLVSTEEDPRPHTKTTY